MDRDGITRRATIGGVAAGLMPLIGSTASPAPTKRQAMVMAGEDFGFRGGASSAANHIALQKAVYEGKTVQLPMGDDPILFDGPVSLPPGTGIVGHGSRTRLLSTGTTAFVCEAPDGSGGDVQAPWLEDFELFCAGSAIRFNRADGGFSDAAGQQALMRPRLNRLRIRRREAGNAGSVGVEFNKCFDGVIIQCEISGFDTGYLGRGSDLIELGGRARIWLCNTLIELISVTSGAYRFGSGTRLIGLDLLGARKCYIRSSDFDLMVEDSYFEHNAENPPLADYAFDITALDRVRFSGNRMQLQASDIATPPGALVPSFLKVTSKPGNLFVWQDNGNDGLAFGRVQWNGGRGQRYWINTHQRSRIIQRGTSGVSPLPLPFNSIDPPQSLPWRFSPSLPGLRNESYGASVLCIDNAFVIPYFGNDDHLSFMPSDAPITGIVDVWIRAKAATPGKMITLYNTNGGKFVSEAKQALTGAFAWHRVFEKLAAENLFLMALNKDRAHAGDIFLGDIVVNMASG